MLQAANVSVDLGNRQVLTGISVRLPSDSLVGLVGPNGSGKTTMIRCLTGLLAPKIGQVVLNGKPISEHSRQSVAQTISYLPQKAAPAWPISVQNLVALGRLPFGATNLEKEALSDIVQSAIAAVDLSEIPERSVTSLSGGELARALLARALAVDAPIMIADEPIAGIDPYHQLQVMDLLAAQAKEGRIEMEGTAEAALTKEVLAAAYGVTAHIGHLDGEPIVVASKRLK